ncbi:MAG: citrate synthase [Planctomycetota bacterium]
MPAASDVATSAKATLTINDQSPVALEGLVGTENELGLDVTALRAKTKAITLDPGYRNTGSCTSDITFINPEAGTLRYRGYPIEELAEHCSFLETAYLLIYGELPDQKTLDTFVSLVSDNTAVNDGLLKILDGFPPDASPMAMLSACINGLCGYHPEVLQVEYEEHFDVTAAKLLGKVSTLAAAIYRHRNHEPGHPTPRPDLDYTTDLLRMSFADGHVDKGTAKAMDLIFLLHADHEQNCSASTCRMVGSSHANLFASCAAAVCALWGPLHGGANAEIMNQLQRIHDGQSIDPDSFIAGVKEKKYRLFGFGHPVYKNYDPRARILKAQADAVLTGMDRQDDPLLKIAKRLEEVALADDYFVSRNLYPNVDFYSGLIMRAMNVPTDMFTVLFAVGRMPGWIAQWKETRDQAGKIYRPRQIYTGPAERHVVPAGER